jgi:uncharacterized membrane protein YsdA (DUF1294 family)
MANSCVTRYLVLAYMNFCVLSFYVFVLYWLDKRVTLVRMIRLATMLNMKGYWQ